MHNDFLSVCLVSFSLSLFAKFHIVLNFWFSLCRVVHWIEVADVFGGLCHCLWFHFSFSLGLYHFVPSLTQCTWPKENSILIIYQILIFMSLYQFFTIMRHGQVNMKMFTWNNFYLKVEIWPFWVYLWQFFLCLTVW